MPEGLTQARLMEVLRYDPETGIFVWIEPPKYHPKLLGKIAGCSATKYVIIKIDRTAYKAHRLAWFYVHGEFPAQDLDHRNREKANNTFQNLRLATRSQNQANSIGRSTKGYPKGVRQTQQGRFVARINHNKKQFCIGVFDSQEEASEAYLAKAQQLFGEFARAG